MKSKNAEPMNTVNKKRTVSRSAEKALKRGKARRVGPIEAIPLQLAGIRDGKHGFPRQDEEGNWTSPVLSRECHSYTEFCDKSWGKTQLDMAGKYTRLGFLLKDMAALEKNLDECRKELEKKDAGFSAERRIGEEDIPDAIVQTRRGREHAKASEPLRTSLQNAKAALTEDLREANALEQEITETNNATRLACERVMDHTRQRADVYWRSAVFHHSDKTHLPVVPRLCLIPTAELVYFQQHKPFLEEARTTIDYLNLKYDVTREMEGKKDE